jgi:potassium-dependent mechanosensitive channel
LLRSKSTFFAASNGFSSRLASRIAVTGISMICKKQNLSQLLSLLLLVAIAITAACPSPAQSPTQESTTAPTSASPAPAPSTADPAASKPTDLKPATEPTAAKTDVETVSETVSAALSWTDQAIDFVANTIFTKPMAWQAVVVLLTGLIAWLSAGPTQTLIDKAWPKRSGPRLNLMRKAVETVRAPLVWVLLLWFANALLHERGFDMRMVRAVASLLNAWVLIRLFSSSISDPFWSKSFATVAWLLAAFNILELLGPTISFLDSIAIKIGDTRLSVYLVLKGLLFAGFLLWIASFLSRLINARISNASALTPSVQTLISQTIRLGLLFGAGMITLSVIGIDLTALAVFSGAVGVGIGFGLQSVFSNLVAGIILLFERSIRVGDFVELADGIQGTVREITIRSTLITTNDNIDVLVPNSEFITKQMTNWTLRDANRRLRIPFGVAYGTDKDLVRTAGLEAANDVEHTLLQSKGREPQVWLVGFGDSSLDFELVVWLKPEAVMRPGAVHADYCWAVESALKKYGIEIPFPQRDLHIRSGRLETVRGANQTS